MSQDIARQETGLSPLQALVQRVGGEDFQKQVALALPDHVRPERFARIAITALRTNPDLAQCEPDSVFNALLRCAQEGLLPDGYEAAIVKRGGKAVYQNMIGGLRKIAAEYGWGLRTFTVWSGDEFDWANILEPPVHRPARPGAERGEIIAAWAVAKHRDGRSEFRVMYADEISQRRAIATTQNVWNKWPGPMAEKTVGRDLFFDLPFAEGDRERILGLLADDIEPGEAAAKLYGGPAAVTPPAIEAPQTAPAVDAPSTTAGDEGQQAAAEAPHPSAEAAVPDPDQLPGEPAPDQPSAFQAPVAVDEDPIVTAANQASELVIPIGAWKGRTLAEVGESGDKGMQWIKYALAHFDEQTGTTPSAEPKLAPGELAHAVWAFARVFAPDLFQAELARREAEAA